MSNLNTRIGKRGKDVETREWYKHRRETWKSRILKNKTRALKKNTHNRSIDTSKSYINGRELNSHRHMRMGRLNYRVHYVWMRRIRRLMKDIYGSVE